MEIEITRAVALISINATLVAQLVSFLVFMTLINRLMYHPLQDVMMERDRQVEQMKKDIKVAEADLEDIFFQIEAETRRVKDEALSVQYKLEKDAARQADALFADVHADIDKLNEETRKEVRRQVAEVRKSLADESEGVSEKIIEKALGRRIAYE